MNYSELLDKYGKVAADLIMGRINPPVRAGSVPMHPDQRHALDNGMAHIRTSIRNLEKIFDERLIRNQHETGQSRGWYDPKARRAVEEKLFGYDKNAPAEHLPKYGFLGNDIDDSTSGYGGVLMRLSKDALKRSTTTATDSYEAMDPAFKLGALVDKSFRRYDTTPEIQVHGPLTLDDIEAFYTLPLQAPYKATSSDKVELRNLIDKYLSRDPRYRGDSGAGDVINPDYYCYGGRVRG
jgi:hypothetical protein